MSMKLDHNENLQAEVNMTPLIDVMLVLLIIFMVSSSVAIESGLEIDIPKTFSKLSSAKAKPLVVAMDQYGRISVNGKKVKYADLEKSIGAGLKTTKSKMVVFEADKRAEIGRTIEIMDISKKAGANKFSIAAEAN
jgi:biopolymer transport protein ExbD